MAADRFSGSRRNEGSGMEHGEQIHIGTSGWQYDHWSGPFYPESCPKRDYLDFYGGRFSAVEINNSFYKLPEPRTLEAWREAAPSDFRFAVKASRYITHMKKLKDPEESLARLLERVPVLEKKLGPILFQLPPNWRFDPDRLRAFADALPGDFRYAFEFRDPSWFDERAYEMLTERNLAFCIYDLEGKLSPKTVTADFVYIRLHGPEAAAYQGSYDTRTLAGWAGAFSQWVRGGKEVFCFFDNDEAGHAANDALALQEMVSG